MTISYEVRFTYYQYNTGRADNGSFILKQAYPTLEAAQEFAKIITQNVRDSEWMYNEFHRHGYVERLNGIWKITEEKVA